MAKSWVWKRFFPPEADVRLILCRPRGGINVLVNGTNDSVSYSWGTDHVELLDKSRDVAYPLPVGGAWYTHANPGHWTPYFTHRTREGTL